VAITSHDTTIVVSTKEKTTRQHSAGMSTRYTTTLLLYKGTKLIQQGYLQARGRSTKINNAMCTNTGGDCGVNRRPHPESPSSCHNLAVERHGSPIREYTGPTQSDVDVYALVSTCRKQIGSGTQSPPRTDCPLPSQGWAGYPLRGCPVRPWESVSREWAPSLLQERLVVMYCTAEGGPRGPCAAFALLNA